MSTVTIIGAGVMGSALAFPARENGNEVRLVGTHLDRGIIDACRKENRHPKHDRKFPEGVKYYRIEEADEAIKGADFVIGGVNSFGVDWFGDFVLPRIPESVPVITVTKGLFDTKDGKLLTYPEIWQSKLDSLGRRLSLNAIGGPCTSYELVAHDQTEVVFCGKDLKVLEKIKGAMQTEYYHISLSTDVIGVESAVALKNAYALGIALTIGANQRRFGLDSKPHFNSQAALFGQSVKEMSLLLDFQKANSLDNLAAGLGDLYVTVYGGRTRRAGMLLGYGHTIDEVTEILKGETLESLTVSTRVARAVLKCSETGILDKKDFPVLMHINEILTEKADVDIPWEKFTFER